MDGRSSSNVTVEYHDPSGIFPLIQDDLLAKLPLRNLHWKSHTRPLRSIASLHIDLVPSKDSASISAAAAAAAYSLPPPQADQGASRRTTEEILRPPTREKERRHQIPGLRQTPYLRIYLLRCDDSEIYKASARKLIREWVKEHTPPSQSSSLSTQEHHDAYDWIILHVVIPDTIAASQPRGASAAMIGEKEKVGATARWTRGTTTILEKLRADFNSSSKLAPDRVAQIRLTRDKVPAHMLSAPGSTSTSVVETPQEQERAWQDVILKFKNLILHSFDLRVSQFEEDIRKNDAQRSFPGWNFNTFFMMKEGLARGFESVGLVDDALLGYDELSIGLDTVISDQAKEGSETSGGVLLDYSQDLYTNATAMLEKTNVKQEDGNQTVSRLYSMNPINAGDKDYRGLILANKISVFDFRLYIFACQMSLLLRLGNSSSDFAAKLQPRANSRSPSRSMDDSTVGIKLKNAATDSEDLFSLAELCSRALNFITFAGRLMREDLNNGAKAHNTKFPEHFVDNIIRSWTFTAIEQVLRETSTTALPFTRFNRDISSASSAKMLSFGGRNKEQKISLAEPKSMIYPARSTSLSNRHSVQESPYSQGAGVGQVVFEGGQFQDRSAPKLDNVAASSKNGLQDLAGSRAQLLAIQRRLLEQLGQTMNWKIGWAAIIPALGQKQEMAHVVLDEESEEAEEQDITEVAQFVNDTRETSSSPTFGISTDVLVNAVSSLEQFRHSYENLSSLIVKHYIEAGQIKSSESVLGDLAAIKFELGDYAAAAMYLNRMASLFAANRWNTVETTMLQIYASCLKKLNRKDEYVRTLLDLLAKSAVSRMSYRTRSQRSSEELTQGMPREWLNDDKIDTTDVFHGLLDYSQNLPYDVTVQMSSYFSDISVEPYIRHYDEMDGFQLRLQLRNVLEDEIEIKAAKVRLVSATSPQSKEIWLEYSEVQHLNKGLCRLWVGCKINMEGVYMVDKITLEAKRIIFVHEPIAKSEAQTPLGIINSVSAPSVKTSKKSRISCFPRPESLQARLYHSHLIHIDKLRYVEIELSSGWNSIQRADIRLKSVSAGLRLRTANVTVTSGDVMIEDKPNPGVIAIGAMSSKSTITLQVPYDLETVLYELNIKIEIDYFTDAGHFHYFSASTIPIELPLDVNVQDHFKSKLLLSKFNIKTANQVPLELLDVNLEGSKEFDVYAPKMPAGTMLVFPRQPVAFTYKINKKRPPVDDEKKAVSSDLSLMVEYRCLDEDVLDKVKKMFTDAVADSPVQRLSRLLTEYFSEKLGQNVLPRQFERVALIQKLDMGLFEDMNWRDCIDTLPPSVRDDAYTWLKKWHQLHKTISLSQSTTTLPTAPPSPHPPRRMIITVSIPQIHILHTTSLTLTPALTSPTTPHPIATAGQPLLTTLRISHTRRWCQPSSLVSAANIPSASAPMDFTYTLEAAPDTWLIAGQRRAHFSASEGEVREWPVMLIPLKPGIALLPTADVRAVLKSHEEAEGQGGDAAEQERLVCEVDCLSYGESVVVIPDVRSSTVGIGDMSLGGARSVVWLESLGQ